MKTFLIFLAFTSLTAFAKPGMEIFVDGPAGEGATITTSIPAPAVPVAAAPIPYNPSDYWNKPSDNSSFWNRVPGSAP